MALQVVWSWFKAASGPHQSRIDGNVEGKAWLSTIEAD